MSWLKKLMPARIRTESGASRKRSVPEGLWEKCDSCGAVLYRQELEDNLEVCPKCDFHMPIRARVRLASFLDPGTGTEIGAELGPTDVLKFKDQKKYVDRIKSSQKATGERDALIVLEGALRQRPIVAAAFDFAFMVETRHMDGDDVQVFAVAPAQGRQVGQPLLRPRGAGIDEGERGDAAAQLRHAQRPGQIQPFEAVGEFGGGRHIHQ